MTALEIILILIGIGIIIFSCFFINSKEQSQVISPDVVMKDFTVNELKHIQETIANKMSTLTDEAFENTKEQLNSICNEKIIAVNEYSNQVIDKISKNHEEVVFLYNMLNEKEEVIKGLLKESNQLNHNISDNKNKKINHSDKSTTNISHNTKAVKKNNANDVVKMAEDILNNGEIGNHNKEIIRLYQEGKTVLEISKLLEIGQGEIKLVIDLYNKI